MLSSPRLINRNHHPRKKIRSKSKAGDLRSTSYLRLGFPCFWWLTERVKSVAKPPVLFLNQLPGDHLLDRLPRGIVFKQLGYSDR
jgi:hypothetical protein